MKKTKMLAVIGLVALGLTIAPISAMAATVSTTTISTNINEDSALGSLSISPGTISPAFNPNITEYNATIPSGTTAIKVFAEARSEKGGISFVTGAKTLEEGENTVKVGCSAYDGSESVYIIHAYVGVSAPASTDSQTTVDTSTTPDSSVATTDSATTPDQTTGTDTAVGTTSPILGVDTTVVSETAIEEPSSSTTTDATADKTTQDKTEKKNKKKVSLKKYNALEEKLKSANRIKTTVIVIAAVVAVMLLIVILNLAIRLKDKYDELKTYYKKEEIGGDFRMSPDGGKNLSKRDRQEIEKSKKAKEEDAIKEAKRKAIEKASMPDIKEEVPSAREEKKDIAETKPLPNPTEKMESKPIKKAQDKSEAKPVMDDDDSDIEFIDIE